MKILRLRIQNINSLRNEHTIDFTVFPFQGTGLFAITGDTGAGKTTILDAMTLALYGKTPRKHENEVLTHGTRECMAEIVFDIEGREYRAKWSRSVNRNDKLREPRYEIVELPSEIPLVRSLKTKVLPKIVELTGLTYEQFLKSVMLAQGDFAAFLKADKNQRSALLEKITGTEEYSKISKAAYERFRIEKEQLDQLKNQLSHIHILNDEEETEIERQHKEQQVNYENVSSQLIINRKLVEWLEDLEHYTLEKKSLSEELEDIKSQFEGLKPDLIRLAAHQKAVIFDKHIYQQKRLIGKVDKSQKQVQKLDDVLGTLQEEMIIVHAKMEENKRHYEILLKQKEAKETLFEEMIELDSELKKLQADVQNKEKNIEILKRNIAKNEREKEKLVLQISRLQTAIESAEIWLKKHNKDQRIVDELSQILLLTNDKTKTTTQLITIEKNVQKLEKNKTKVNQNLGYLNNGLTKIVLTINELKVMFEDALPQESTQDFQDDINSIYQHIQEIQREINQYQQFISGAENVKSLEKDQENIWGKLDNADLLLEKYKEQLEELSADLKRAKEREKDKLKIYEQEKLIKNYEADRANLEQGEKCPLCFSNEHPCHSHNYQPQVSQTKRDWNEAKRYLKAIEKKQTTFQTQIKSEKNNILTIRSEQKNLQTTLSNAQSKLDNFDEKIVKLYRNSGNNLATLHEKIAVSSDILQQFEETHVQIIKIKSQYDKQVLNQKDKLAEIATKQEQLQNIEAQLIDYQKEKVISIQEIEQLTTTIQTALNPFQLNIKSDYITELTTRKDNFQIQKEAFQKNSQLLELTETKLTALTNSLQQNYAALGDDSTSMQILNKEWREVGDKRQKRFGDKDPRLSRAAFRKELAKRQNIFEQFKERQSLTEKSLIAKEQTQKVQQKQLKLEAAELKQITHFLNEKALEQGFENRHELARAILAKHLTEGIQDAKDQLTAKRTKKQQSLDDATKKLETLSAQKLTSIPIETLEEQYLQLTNQQKEYAETLGSLKEKLAQNEQYKIQFADHQLVINKQAIEFQRWDKLKDMIGSADGKKFRVYAQSLTLRKLVSIANLHLKKLNDRYFIIKSETDALQLNILDHYQGNSVRSMTTLSGGESFLVSLALALGLSDLAGRNAHIQSLFIDEGFGTLDGKNLDLVIQTLDNLQSSGKTIGVISHVLELKERIDTQIKVVKKGGGFSTFEIHPRF